MDRGIGVVAIERVVHASDRRAQSAHQGDRSTRAVAVTVVVEVAVVRRAAVVDDTVAVVVDTVTADLHHVRANAVVGIVAVAAPGDLGTGTHRLVGEDGGRTRTIPITVAIDVASQRCARQQLVCRGIAVVVDAVAELSRTGTNRRIGVVAVAAHTNLANKARGTTHRHPRTKPIAVSIEIAELVGAHETVVDTAEAVVVDTIAELGTPRPNGRIAVVAVATHVRRARRAVRERVMHTDTGTDTVGIAVAPARHRLADEESAVDGTVAVVVHPVAGFDLAGINIHTREKGVVAVTRERHLTLKTGRTGARHTRARTEPVAVDVAVAHDEVADVDRFDHTVAVIVDAVADLDGRRVHLVIGVVAVTSDGGERRTVAIVCRADVASVRYGLAVAEPVVVGVAEAVHGGTDEVLVHDSVAVVVDLDTDQLAHLGSAGVDERISVVAITADLSLSRRAGDLVGDEGTGTRTEPVAVGVGMAGDAGARQTVCEVDETIAVVVDVVVADLGFGSDRVRIVGFTDRRRDGEGRVAHRVSRLGAEARTEDTRLIERAVGTFDRGTERRTDAVDTWCQLILPAELACGPRRVRGVRGHAERAVPTVTADTRIRVVGRRLQRTRAERPRPRDGIAELLRIRQIRRRAGDRTHVPVARLVAGRSTGARESLVAIRDIEGSAATGCPEECHAHHRHDGEMSTEHITLYHLYLHAIF